MTQAVGINKGGKNNMDLTNNELETMKKIILYLYENNKELYNELRDIIRHNEEEDRIKQKQYDMLNTIDRL